MEWKTPEIVVLIRSKPEEGVLTSCKDTGFIGANTSAGGCLSISTCEPMCSAIVTS